MTNRTSRKFGWVPDVPDQRDHVYAIANLSGQLPSKIDLHDQCPPVYDQGHLGSCTANALAAAFDFERKRQNLEFMNPSRLFIYYNERVREGTVDQDSGAAFRDGMKSIATEGACPESLWPYQVDRFAARPDDRCYLNGARHTALEYSRLNQDVVSLKACLAAGYPFCLGISVYESFQAEAVFRTGKVPLPSMDERSLGGHAALAVGYSDASERFLIRNSWGPDWGIHGHFTLPYDYVCDPNLADDFWTIRLVR